MNDRSASLIHAAANTTITYEELEERDHSKDTKGVAEERHDGTKLRERRVQHRAQEEREQEEDQEDRGVPHDRADGDDGDTDERARRLLPVLVGERLDEHIRDDKERGHDDREDDLREDDRPPFRAGHVAREALGGVAEAFLLVPSDHRAGETAEADPRVGVRARVATVHPAEELPAGAQVSRSGRRAHADLPIVDDEVGRGELVRVEQERRHAEREDGHPEVGDPSRPDRQRHVQEHDERAHAEVDARTREARVEDRERDARRRETTTRRDVPRTAEGQVRDDRVRRDLRGEHLEGRGKRPEVFRETKDCLASTTFDQF